MLKRWLNQPTFFCVAGKMGNWDGEFFIISGLVYDAAFGLCPNS